MWPIVTDGVASLAWYVCLSVGPSVMIMSWCRGLAHLIICKDGWTDRDAVWNVDSGGPKEPRIRREYRSLPAEGQFWGQKGAQTCPAVDMLKATQQGTAPVRCECRLGCTRRRCTLAQSGEYDWTVRVRRRYGLLSNYSDHFW